MEKQLLQGYTVEDRIAHLQDVAEKTELFTYSRELSLGETEELKNELSQNFIRIDQEENVLKQHKEAFNAVVKPLKQRNKEVLQMVRTGMEEVMEPVYLLKDNEEGKMGYYSKEGKLVFERSLKPEENQISILNVNRKSS